jgi:hypothetical protein
LLAEEVLALLADYPHGKVPDRLLTIMMSGGLSIHGSRGRYG